MLVYKKYTFYFNDVLNTLAASPTNGVNATKEQGIINHAAAEQLSRFVNQLDSGRTSTLSYTVTFGLTADTWVKIVCSPQETYILRPLYQIWQYD